MQAVATRRLLPCGSFMQVATRPYHAGCCHTKIVTLRLFPAGCHTASSCRLFPHNLCLLPCSSFHAGLIMQAVATQLMTVALQLISCRPHHAGCCHTTYDCCLAALSCRLSCTQPHLAGCRHTTYDYCLATHFMQVAIWPKHAGCCHAACNVPFLT